jgi:hypothetical protein
MSLFWAEARAGEERYEEGEKRKKRRGRKGISTFFFLPT